MKNNIFVAATVGALMIAGTVCAQGYRFDPHAGGLFGHIDRISHSIQAHEDRGDIRPREAERALADLRDIKAEAREIIDRNGQMRPDQWHMLSHRANAIGERVRLSEADAGGWGE